MRILWVLTVVAVVTASPAVRRVKVLRSQRQMAPVYGPPPEEPIAQPSEEVPPQVEDNIPGLVPPTEAPRTVTEPEPTPMRGNNFFPINFGRSAGGSIAIGNSFATGAGGKAESHATAFGGPSARLEMPPQDGYKYEQPNPPFEENPTELPSETVTEIITTELPTEVTEATEITEVETEAPKPVPSTPARKVPKKKTPRRNPFLGNIPFGNFFPITFGPGIPGGSTAIANSFSTGSKGKANSQAASFGPVSARLESPPQGTMLVGFFDESMKQPKFFTFQMGQNMEEQQPEATETKPLPEAPVEDAEDSDEDDEDDSEEESDFGFKQAGGLYNFFPISFGGSVDSAAVANSFTTGRKGMANSYATSNGKSARLEAPQEEASEVQEDETVQEQPEEEESDELDAVPKEQTPLLYNFFPIVFAGFERNAGNGISSTAIANSFSTGKKGVANSQATSYGSGKSARLETPPELPEVSESVTEVVETTEEAETEAPVTTEAPVDTPTEASVETPVEPKRRSKSRPVNNIGSGLAFFPISFGRRLGGSVSIANSFSTGKNGAANSYSTSYGSRTKRSPQSAEESVPAEEAPVETEDDPQEIPDEENPLLRGLGGYYNFFPINFSYGARKDEGSNPGTVAIANSFSTGRGGVANSHATVYGFGIPKDRN